MTGHFIRTHISASVTDSNLVSHQYFAVLMTIFIFGHKNHKPITTVSGVILNIMSEKEPMNSIIRHSSVIVPTVSSALACRLLFLVLIVTMLAVVLMVAVMMFVCVRLQ